MKKWLFLLGIFSISAPHVPAISALDPVLEASDDSAEIAEAVAIPEAEATPDDPLYYSYNSWDVIGGRAEMPATIPVQEMKRIRIAAYNLEHFTDGEDDPPERTPERLTAHTRGAAKLIDKIDPDVIILQEIENKQALRILNDALSKPYPVGHITFFRHPWGEVDKLNIAVLSRVPLKSVRTVRFSRANAKSRPPRGLLAFEIEIAPGHRILVYGLHLKSNFGSSEVNQRQRRRALEILADDAESVRRNNPSTHYEIAILGDTNVDPDNEQFADDPSLDPLSAFADLWRGRPIEERTTIPTREGDPALLFPPAAFDRIFVCTNLMAAPWIAGPAQVLQKGVHIRDVSVLPGDKGHVSDHHPVFVDLLRDELPAPKRDKTNHPPVAEAGLPDT